MISLVCLLISATTVASSQVRTGPRGADTVVELFDSPSGFEWAQKGSKLYVDGPATYQGQCVAITAGEFGFELAYGGYDPTTHKGQIYTYHSSNGNTWGPPIPVFPVDFPSVNQGGVFALNGGGDHIIAGGPLDSSNAGSAWIYQGGGGTTSWSLIDSKITPLPSTPGAQCGASVALDSGPTVYAIACPPYGVYLYSFAGTSFSQNQAIANSQDPGSSTNNFGAALALSGDGSTLAVGLPGDNAVNIYHKSTTTFGEQQTNLQATDHETVSTAFGTSLALSGSGSTLVVGDPMSNQKLGGVWVFTRSGSVWTQAAALIPTGFTGPSSPPYDIFVGLLNSLSINGAGNIIAAGGPGDNGGIGAAWVWRLLGTEWVQDPVVISTGLVSATPGQGWSVALIGNGATLVSGAPADDSNVGGVVIFTSSVVPTPSPTPAPTPSPTPSPTPKATTQKPTTKKPTTKKPTTKAPTTKAPLVTKPRFITYDTITKGTISALTQVQFTFKNTATFTTPRLLNGAPYKAAPGPNNQKFRLTQTVANTTVTIKLTPALATNFFIYAAQWPEGSYHFTPNTWNILSHGTQTFTTAPDAQGRRTLTVKSQFSGIINFPRGVTQVSWEGKPTSGGRIAFTVAKQKS